MHVNSGMHVKLCWTISRIPAFWPVTSQFAADACLASNPELPRYSRVSKYVQYSSGVISDETNEETNGDHNTRGRDRHRFCHARLNKTPSFASPRFTVGAKQLLPSPSRELRGRVDQM